MRGHPQGGALQRTDIHIIPLICFECSCGHPQWGCTTKDTLQKFLNHCTHKLLNFKINCLKYILKYIIQINITREEKLTKYKITNKMTKFLFTNKCTFYLSLKMLKFTLNYLIFAHTCFGPPGPSLGSSR
jgi:hypothetical protein